MNELTRQLAAALERAAKFSTFDKRAEVKGLFKLKGPIKNGFCYELKQVNSIDAQKAAKKGFAAIKKKKGTPIYPALLNFTLDDGSVVEVKLSSTQAPIKVYQWNTQADFKAHAEMKAADNEHEANAKAAEAKIEAEIKTNGYHLDEGGNVQLTTGRNRVFIWKNKLDDVMRDLKAGKIVHLQDGSFDPSSYVLYPNGKFGEGTAPAKPGLAKFFGCPNLWVGGDAVFGR